MKPELLAIAEDLERHAQRINEASEEVMRLGTLNAAVGLVALSTDLGNQARVLREIAKLV